MAAVNLWEDRSQWTHGIPPEIHPADAEVLEYLTSSVKRPGMSVVEVGSWVGNGSTRVLVESLRDCEGILYCVDTWAGSDNVPHHLEYRKHHGSMFEIFSENVRLYRGEPIVRPLIMPSVSASKLFPDRSVDLVFIDGNHGYSQIRQDILAWLPRVRNGGILCGHDCDADFAQFSASLWRDIEAKCEEDVFASTSPTAPPMFHPGVVKAVNELLGSRATLWTKVKPSSIWSCTAGSAVGRLSAFLRSHMPILRKQGRVPLPAASCELATP